jgi:predicted ATPase
LLQINQIMETMQITDALPPPELAHLRNVFSKIRIYREWSFGRHTPARLPQKTDSPNDYLEPDASNLSLVLNKLCDTPSLKKKLLKALNALYGGIDDFHGRIEGGTVQTIFIEGDRSIPATRLSDGTLRYLSLLVILLNPNQGSMVCIEEPELGLHPDVLPTLADLIKEASQHTQLIVTTHSDVLIDALSDTPESVLVAERDENGTILERLDAEQLKPWLKNYRLGQLWTDGQIGGKRW